MSEREYKELQAALLVQRKKVGKSKEAAKKVLVDLGIFNLLVPKPTEDKSGLSL